MKKTLCLLIIIHYFSVYEALADDIEVVMSSTAPNGGAYVHVVLDSSSTAFNTMCLYGPGHSCAPPFMTASSYANLLPAHSPGDSVTRLEVFTAVLASLFEDSQFSQLTVSLFISGRDSGGEQLSGYRRLGGDYDGVSGSRILIDAMRSASISGAPAPSHNFQAKGAFSAWYRYLNEEPPVFASPEACPLFFSVILATESTTEDGMLDPGIRRDMAIPGSARRGFADLLEKMHSGTVDLVTGGLAGINHLSKTWVVAPGAAVDLARDWAKRGATGGPINIDDPSEMERRLRIAFTQAIALSRSNTTPGLPMAAFGRTKASRDFFVPLYEPGGTLRWPGNVKKFKRDTLSELAEAGADEIKDARGMPAFISAGDDKGQIAFNALSYWTDAVSLPPDPVGEISIGADGPVVTRGGAGQNIPGFIRSRAAIIGRGNEEHNARQLWVEPASIVNGSANRLLPFNADGSSEGSTAMRLLPVLGASAPAEAEALILWGRGMDVDDEDGDGLVMEPRPWIMGSVMHSRPLALNYGAVAGYTSGNPNIQIFVGTGDGIFHGIENTTSAGEESGRETFGFYPTESLANIALQRDDMISSLEMRYGVDGSPVSFTVDNNGDGNLNHESPDNDEAYVYFGMRRGGYSYYGLDVSDPAVTPVLKWKISRTSAGGDFPELGLSFSRPIVGRVKYEETALDVLIFAGGYNGGWDSGYSNRVGKDRNSDNDVSVDGRVSTGNALYIVNARTGELVWKAVYGAITSTATTSTNTQFRHVELVDSIPSSVSAVKNFGGIIHRLYVGDTGGAIWRVDLPLSNSGVNADHRKEKWFVSKLAELGTDGHSTDRRFFHAPDIVRSKQNDGTPFDGVLISSGNRANPNSVDVVNYHFYIKDYLVASGDDAGRDRSAITISDTPGASDLPDRTECLMESHRGERLSCTLSMESGWMIKLNRPGEKGLSSPLVDGGQVYFSSYVPATPQACTAVAGQGYLYLVNLEDAVGVNPGQSVYPLGAGIPPAVIALDDRLLVPLGGIGEIEESECSGALCVRRSTRLHKIYWREPGIDEF